MAYVNNNANGRHGIFESSRLKATDVGRIYDALVYVAHTTGEGQSAVTTKDPIEIDNGVAVKIEDFTGNGLQEVYAKIAGVGDKIAVIGTPAIVKDARIAADEIREKFSNHIGRLAKAYEVLDDSYEIFGIADYQFTDASVANVKVGAYVVVDGNGMWVAQAAKPSASTYGFIGRIHSLAPDSLGQETVVRIQCVQNKQIS